MSHRPVFCLTEHRFLVNLQLSCLPRSPPDFHPVYALSPALLLTILCCLFSPWFTSPHTDGILAEYHAHLRAGGAPRSGIVQGARRLTVAEAALLQTFPAYLTFAGSRASQYIQVGNAVPPDLAAAMARALVRSLDTEPIQVAA